MEFILSRYRNLMVLVVAIVAQLLLLAYQVRSEGEVRLIRVWAVSAVTPLARLLEGTRSGVAHFFSNYFALWGAQQENQRLHAELDRARMENQYLRTELSTAERAKALELFERNTPGKFVAARIISNTTSSGALVVIVDRGASSGIQKGMAVRTPEGIVGKVISVYPAASFVRLVTDVASAAGVVNAKGDIHGTLRGQGRTEVLVDHVANEQKVQAGEWFYTSGDDLIYPRGIPVGQVRSTTPGPDRQEILITPSGLRKGLEEVLIITEGVHLPLPAQAPDAQQPVHVQQPPVSEAPVSNPDSGVAVAVPPVIENNPMGTDADRMIDKYRKLGEAQKHVYGAYGSRPPNFNPPPAPPPAPVQ